jgi:HK97 family phage portal protein
MPQICGMGLFDRISNWMFRTEARSNAGNGSNCQPTSGVAGWWDSLWGIDTKSGIKVNRKSILGIPAVWRAVSILGGSIASLKIGLYRETNAGSEIQRKHPLSRLFAHEPHPHYSTFEFIRTLVINASLGNGYAWIERDQITARPKRLHILDPDQTQVYLSTEGILLYYTHYLNKTLVLLHDEVIHLAAPSFDAINGEKVVETHRENFGVGIAATQYGSAFFGNGATPSGVIYSPDKLDDSTRDRIRKGWFAKYGGVDKVGQTAVLDGGMTFTKIGLNPQETQLVECRKFTVAEVSRIFGVPPHLLHDLDRATFNSVEMLSISFVQFTLLHYAKQIEAEFNRKLLTEAEKDSGAFFFRFNIDSLLRGDTASRAAYYNTLFNVGAISSNEIRRLENMNDREGGDEYFVSLAMKGSQSTPEPDPKPNPSGKTQPKAERKNGE